MKQTRRIEGIAPEGVSLLAAGTAATALTALFSRRAALLPLALTVGTAAFLRDPQRQLPTDDTRLWSAADGTIMRVDEINEQRFIGGPALRIVTFLSLFDVHINRAPTAGTVRYVEHLTGEFRAAWDAQCDTVNERNYVGLTTAHGPLLLVQIAGLVARRIVFTPHQGDNLATGERIGLIKFGSRTDVMVPRSSTEALVVPGMHVKAGLTPIGAWR
ncbi:MAG: phosphatidylserine decarboxylase [Herpetosiphonaceae bacterium]|nr:phosphatidylserine decarboxylase [Herpetosiphonaceae bacterium]